MKIKGLYGGLTRKDYKTRMTPTSVVYDAKTGEVTSVHGGVVIGTPCASPIQFNRKIKRNMYKNSSVKLKKG